MEIDEDGDAIPPDGLPGQATLVRIPNLYCDFLWPFAGRAHPRNRGAFALPGGPYPAEHGDRFLDQMVAEAVDEDTALARYTAMDIVADGELDSRLSDRTDILLRLDAAAGYDLASYIVDTFRTEPLFRTRQRLTLPLLRRLTGQLFAKLGVQGWSAESLRRVPFPPGAQPIHPGVIAHFGLTWVAADQEYPVNEEGFFSFDAFGRRYMRFAWNEGLHRGIQTAKTDLRAALADLESGVAESPESPLGRRALLAARRAAGLDHSAADPSLVIDEESYDPASEGDEPDLAAPAPPADAPPAAPESGLPEPDDAPAPASPPEAAAPADDNGSGKRSRQLPRRGRPDRRCSAICRSRRRAARTGRAADQGIRRARQAIDLAAAGVAQARQHRRRLHRFSPARPRRSRKTRWLRRGNDLIEVLPRLLPVFADLASAVDRPFGAMPETMPPPPLRPILPPELQEDQPRPGLLARMLGRK